MKEDITSERPGIACFRGSCDLCKGLELDVHVLEDNHHGLVPPKSKQVDRQLEIPNRTCRYKCSEHDTPSIPPLFSLLRSHCLPPETCYRAVADG